MSDEKIVAALQDMTDGQDRPGVFEEQSKSTVSVNC
jgi:hypothetical protein